MVLIPIELFDRLQKLQTPIPTGYKEILQNDAPKDFTAKQIANEAVIIRGKRLRRAAPLPTIPITSEPATEAAPADVFERSVLEMVPEKTKDRIALLIEHIKNYPGVLSWDERGEIEIYGETHPNTNIAHLIADLASNKRKTQTPGMEQFLYALNEIDVPSIIIPNPYIRTHLDQLKTQIPEKLPEGTQTSPMKDLAKSSQTTQTPKGRGRGAQSGWENY